MRHSLSSLVLGLVVGISGCSGDEDCAGVLCGPCPQAIQMHVRLAGVASGVVTASGVDGVGCSAAGDGSFYCNASSVAPGTYTLTIAAPGHVPETVTFTLAPRGAGCCACSGSVSRELTLASSTDSDGGLAPDAGVGPDAGVVTDAGGGDGGSTTCDPSALSFIPPGGSLSVGQLCDDVFVCVDGASAAATVMSASARFSCSATPEGPCPGWTCAYRNPGGPSTLDADEISEICKVTVLVPRPAMTCMIYL